MENRHEFFVRRLKELGMYDADSDYGGVIGKSVEALSGVFQNQRNNGWSAEITLGLFNQLFKEWNNA